MNNNGFLYLFLKKNQVHLNHLEPNHDIKLYSIFIERIFIKKVTKDDSESYYVCGLLIKICICELLIEICGCGFIKI